MKVSVVFSFVIMVICYYEYVTVMRVHNVNTRIQPKNLRQEYVERRLGSTATITLASISDGVHFSYIYNQVVLWTGPISLVVSVSPQDVNNIEKLEKDSNLPSRVKVTNYAPSKRSFPINTLRNIAYRNSDTTHVLMLDQDIIPAPTLYSALLSLPPSVLDDPKLAIVIPLFEMTHYNVFCSNWYSCDKQLSLYYSLKKYDLRMCLLTNGCTNLGFNGANQYVKSNWLTLPSDNQTTPFYCWANTRQQPFVLVRKSPSVPEFEEHMEDYGNNRLEWINHLRFRGFRFTLLSQSWLYHLRHKPSELSVNYDRKRDVNSKILSIKEFEFSQQYKDNWRLPLCEGMEESYPNPGMTLDKYLENIRREDSRKQSEWYLKDQRTIQKFAKKKTKEAQT